MFNLFIYLTVFERSNNLFTFWYNATSNPKNIFIYLLSIQQAQIFQKKIVALLGEQKYP